MHIFVCTCSINALVHEKQFSSVFYSYLRRLRTHPSTKAKKETQKILIKMLIIFNSFQLIIRNSAIPTFPARSPQQSSGVSFSFAICAPADFGNKCAAGCDCRSRNRWRLDD